MSYSVRYNGDFGGERTKAAETQIEPAAPPPPTRVMRQLALAYRVEAIIESGTLRDFADAARRLGITRARMTQIANLRWLPCEVQERILNGERLSERGLRMEFLLGNALRVAVSQRGD